MYNNWIEDQNEKYELAKNHAYLMGWFWNPEAVQKLTGEDSERHVSTEEDFEKTLQLVRDSNNHEDQENKVERKKRKRNRKLKDN